MYFGTLLMLIGVAVLLGSAFAAVFALTYVVYIDRFQIRPEERVLRERFGEAYVTYASGVRRWA